MKTYNSLLPVFKTKCEVSEAKVVGHPPVGALRQYWIGVVNADCLHKPFVTGTVSSAFVLNWTVPPYFTRFDVITLSREADCVNAPARR